jgi:hypothetical protein
MSYPSNLSSPESPQADVYALWHVCRSVEHQLSADDLEFHDGIRTVEFRIDAGNKLAYAVKNPPTIRPSVGAFCFYSCPPLPKSAPFLNDVFRSMRPRLEQLVVTPASDGEFSGGQALVCESLGHEARFKASVEKDPERRARLIKRANFMYEAGLRMVGHRTILLMLDRMARHPDEVYVVRINDRVDSISRFLRRFISSSFVGLAICAIYENNFARFGSFSSLAVGWDDIGGVFGLNTARVIAVLSDRLDMYLFATRNVLMPYLVRTGRESVFADELRLCVSGRVRRDMHSTVMALAARFGGPVPPEGTHVRTRIVGGRMVEKMCAVCDSTGKVRHCARCRAIYYCSKECQQAHWAEHRVMCGQSDCAARRAGADMFVALSTVDSSSSCSGAAC